MSMDLFSAAVEAKTYTKPVREYVLPTMAELEAVSGSNGLTAVGSFSGCGGASTGLRWAGWDVRVAIEFIPAAIETYQANSSAVVVGRDIRSVTGAELLAHAGLSVGELDLFEGSPPCSSWSAAGTGHKTRERPCEACGGTGDVNATVDAPAHACVLCSGTGRLEGEAKKYSDSEQRTDDLFDHYVRLIKEMQPRAFLAENVPGLITGPAIEYVRGVTEGLSKLGYRVASKVLNAANFGAATERERLIFMGIRSDQDVWPSFPSATVPEAYTIKDALAVVREDRPDDVAASSMEGKAVGRTWHEKRDALLEGRALDTEAVPCERCGKPGRDHRKVRTPAKEFNYCDDGVEGKVTKDYYLLVVPDPDKPCPTITATGSQVGAASVTHPDECRKFTPREAATIMGFPLDFRLTGTREQRYERVGRAVAPPMYKAVGEHLASLLGP